MPRPFWSGTLTFGLVSVPVRLYSAVRSSGSSLRMVDEDGTPLARRYYCPAEGREVSRDELVRGYEVEDGRFVVLTEEELDALEPEKSREIDLRRFVPLEALDPVFFQRPYVLVPAEGSTKAYRLLAETMERTKRAGVATFVMRTKEYLVAILAEGGVLRAETMRFHDEVRTAEDVGLPEPEKGRGGRTKAMEAFMKKAREKQLDREELEDHSAEELEALVARKRERGEGVRALSEGQRPEEDEEDEEEGVIDLMAVLRRSLAEGDGDRARAGPARAGAAEVGGDGAARSAAAEGGDAGRLDELTRSELYERAQELEVPGRSSMKKDELLEAVRKAARPA